MNTSIKTCKTYSRKGMMASIFAIALSLLAGSCSENEITETAKSQLRIEVGTTDSRVSYDALHSTFDEDDLIGCVIADISNGSPVYKSVSTWKYKSGILILQDDGTASWESEKKWLTTDAEGYLTLKNSEIKYAFYFFYPVYNTSNTVLPGQDENSSSYWKKYTASIETDQNSKENMNKSDFLWIKYDKGISASDASQKPISLVFKKEFATIEIDAETELQNVSFIKEEKGILKAKSADLSTGELSDITYNNWDTNKPVYNEGVTPYKFDNEGKQYRLSIPPQDIDGLHLKFTFSPYSNSQNIDLNLAEKLQTVEGGKIYYIKINKSGDTSIVIKDWENGKYSILEEDQE